ncbi:hypothetical protein [Streptomyces sp. NPDC093544]|jgi:hypothetical protein|uniref:hypothetical protein n=1 Tax=Streptomyces sp. NPDC093544 TaxID=3155200 RepID=UPI003427BE96
MSTSATDAEARFDAEATLRAIQHHVVTSTRMVPTHFYHLALVASDRPAVRQKSRSSSASSRGGP